MSSETGKTLLEIYEALRASYGPQHWWPGESRTEVAVGAILTQNTNWRNVEKAIAALRAAGCLDWEALRAVELPRLAELIRPAGYYNIKAKRLKNFVDWLWREHDGDFEGLAAWSAEELRVELLGINGIGPETADSILLYALDQPTFVVDAYTARMARRHGLIDDEAGYYELQALFEENLPVDLAMFNEYHALIVAVGKAHCRPRARCEGCPLERFDHDVGPDESNASEGERA